MSIEPLVIQAVLAKFTREALRDVIDSKRLQSTDVRMQVQKAERTVDLLEGRVSVAVDAELDARKRGDHAGEVRYRQTAERLEGERDVAKKTLDALKRRVGAEGELTRAEAAQLVALATDLPALLARAEAFPGMVRRILSHLLHGVHVNRRVRGVLDVGLEYPGGTIDWLVVPVRSIRVTSAERAYALGRLRDGASADTVARELDRIMSTLQFRTPWTAQRVEVLRWSDRAGLAVEQTRPFGTVFGRRPTTIHTVADGYVPPDRNVSGNRRPPRPSTTSRPESLRSLAERIGAPLAEVTRHAFHGNLGTAVWENGELKVCADEAALHWNFRDYARRWVAAKGGWPERDTISVSEARRRTGRSYNFIKRVAREGSGERADLWDNHYVRWSEVEAEHRKRPKRRPKGSPPLPRRHR